jgi:hypothetical protein
MWNKNLSCTDNFHTFLPKQFKWQFKKISKIKFAYVTKDTAKTSIKNHIYYYTTPREMVISDSNGMTGKQHIASTGAILFFWTKC